MVTHGRDVGDAVISRTANSGNCIWSGRHGTPRRRFPLPGTPTTARFESSHRPLRLPIMFRVRAVRLLPIPEIPLDSRSRQVYFNN